MEELLSLRKMHVGSTNIDNQELCQVLRARGGVSKGNATKINKVNIFMKDLYPREVMASTSHSIT